MTRPQPRRRQKPDSPTSAEPLRGVVDHEPVAFDRILLGYNSRQNYLGIDELALDIGANGLIEAVVIQRDSEREGFYILRAGFRRYKAIQQLRKQAAADGRPVPFETVPCRELVNASELDAIVINLAENHAREDLSIWEQGTTFRMLRESFTLTHEQIATRVGYSRAHVQAAIQVVEKMHPDIVKYLKMGQHIPQNMLFAWKSLPFKQQIEEFDKWRKVPSKKRGPKPQPSPERRTLISPLVAARLEQSISRHLAENPGSKELRMAHRLMRYVLRQTKRPPVKILE